MAKIRLELVDDRATLNAPFEVHFGEFAPAHVNLEGMEIYSREVRFEADLEVEVVGIDTREELEKFPKREMIKLVNEFLEEKYEEYGNKVTLLIRLDYNAKVKAQLISDWESDDYESNVFELDDNN